MDHEAILELYEHYHQLSCTAASLGDYANAKKWRAKAHEYFIKAKR